VLRSGTSFARFASVAFPSSTEEEDATSGEGVESYDGGGSSLRTFPAKYPGIFRVDDHKLKTSK